MKEVQSSHHAPNTAYVYGTGMLALMRFCIYFGWCFKPICDPGLAAFVVFQSTSCSYGTLKVYLYGIRDWTLRQGLPFPPWTSRYAVYSAMMGVKRIWGHEQKQKLAVSPELLLAMVNLLNPTDFNHVMLKAAMLVAFFGMFRKDNITIAKASAFNPRANLTRGDFIIKGPRVWIRVGHSKTNQFGSRVHWVPLEPIPGSPLCPVTAVLLVLDLLEGEPSDSPMFRWRSTKTNETLPMTHTNFVTAFKGLVKKCGLDWNRYSGHNFRRGGATFAFNLGVNAELIQYIGDWASDAYQRYQELSSAMRLALPQAMAQAIAEDPLYRS